MSSRPSDVDYFTPLFESIIDKVGVIGAAVHGRVWRYCQGDRGKCQASMETIASELRVSRHTVLRYLTQLCREGFLIDHTPGLRNRPHTYTVAELDSKSEEVLQSATLTVAESHTHCSRESHEERSKREVREKESAANADPPNATDLWPAESNLEPCDDPPKEPITGERDYITDLVAYQKRTGGKPAWTVVGPEGDPYLDGPLAAACAILRVSPDVLGIDTRQHYATQIRRIVGDIQDGTPELFVKACRAWSAHGPAWKGKQGAPYPNVFSKGFAEDISNLMQQIQSGTLGQVSKEWSQSF